MEPFEGVRTNRHCRVEFDVLGFFINVFLLATLKGNNTKKEIYRRCTDARVPVINAVRYPITCTAHLFERSHEKTW